MLEIYLLYLYRDFLKVIRLFSLSQNFKILFLQLYYTYFIHFICSIKIFVCKFLKAKLFFVVSRAIKFYVFLVLSKKNFFFYGRFHRLSQPYYDPQNIFVIKLNYYKVLVLLKG